jgi:hypothetical protein
MAAVWGPGKGAPTLGVVPAPPPPHSGSGAGGGAAAGSRALEFVTVLDDAEDAPHDGDELAPHLALREGCAAPGCSRPAVGGRVVCEGPNWGRVVRGAMKRRSPSRFVLALTGALLLACGTPPVDTAADRRAATRPRRPSRGARPSWSPTRTGGPRRARRRTLRPQEHGGYAQVAHSAGPVAGGERTRWLCSRTRRSTPWEVAARATPSGPAASEAATRT